MKKNRIFVSVILATTALNAVEIEDLSETLLEASKNIDVKVATKLIQEVGVSPIAYDKYDDTPLHYACINASLELVTLLIGANAPINATDVSLTTPLHQAARFADEKIVEALLQAGAEIDALSDTGYTPLHESVSSSNVSTTRTLLDKGANHMIRTKHRKLTAQEIISTIPIRWKREKMEKFWKDYFSEDK